MRTKKALYFVYLFILPILFVSLTLLLKSVDENASRTYTSDYRFVTFAVTLLSGVLIGIDTYFMKSACFSKKGFLLIKLIYVALLLIAYILVYLNCILNVKDFIYAAGYQLITSFLVTNPKAGT